MKKLFVFIIVVGLLVAGAWKLGWIGVTNTSTTTGVTLDKEKMGEDLTKASDKAKEMGGKAVDKTKEVIQDVKDKVKDEKKTTEKPVEK